MVRIMVVEDNMVNMKLVSDLLSMEGYQVTACGDGEEALELLVTDKPDLILMDVALPGINGLELTARIKKEERIKHIPIVALTAFAMKGDKQKVLEAGCDGYITKPIDTRKFIVQINRFLKK